MSGLFRLPPGKSEDKANSSPAPQPGMVDPTVELIQPGGPFPYGEAILTDGAGGYTIAPTLRPYCVSFAVPGRVKSSRGCKHHGVDSQKVGHLVMVPVSLIGVGVVVDKPVDKGNAFHVEIFAHSEEERVICATLRIGPGSRKEFRRGDLSVPLKVGSEIGARIKRQSGSGESAFSMGIVTVELES